MNPLDTELRNLLRRKEPAEGFADRVMAVLSQTPRRLSRTQRIYDLFRNRALRWAAVTGLVVVMAGLGWARYQRQQRFRAQAEEASREAILALRITTTELNVALERAERATERGLLAKNPSDQWGD